MQQGVIWRGFSSFPFSLPPPAEVDEETAPLFQ
jgi:hypothetical protein